MSQLNYFGKAASWSIIYLLMDAQTLISKLVVYNVENIASTDNTIIPLKIIAYYQSWWILASNSAPAQQTAAPSKNTTI